MKTGEFITANASLNDIVMWVLFGFIVVNMDCNLQKEISSRPLFAYLILLLSCFFLFVAPRYQQELTPQVPEAPPTLGNLWIRAAVIFLSVAMWINSKWPFAVAALLLLVVDQLVKYHYTLKLQNSDEDGDDEQSEKIQRFLRWFSPTSSAVIAATLLVGSGLYFYDLVRNQKLSLWEVLNRRHEGKCGSDGVQHT